jgi:hypothetical protein
MVSSDTPRGARDKFGANKNNGGYVTTGMHRAAALAAWKKHVPIRTLAVRAQFRRDCIRVRVAVGCITQADAHEADVNNSP